MGEWKNEEEIRRELRVLTDELKHLREELRAMVTPRKQDPTRAFLHRQSWPAPSATHDNVVGSADERKRPAGRRHPTTGKPDPNGKDR